MRLLHLWGGLVLLLFGCVAGKKVVIRSHTPEAVPYLLNSKALVDVAGGTWYLNGRKTVPDSKGRILITESGEHRLSYRFYFKGKVDSSVTTFTALPPEDYCNAILTTPKGQIVLQLSAQAPRHSDNFERLINEGYYDSLIFHRIIPGFVVQGGDPQQTPFKRLSDLVAHEMLDAEFHPDLLHYKGALAAARAPDHLNPEKRSSPDQFYIVQGTPFDEERWEQYLTEQGAVYKSYQKGQYLKRGGSPQLDGEYTVFGYLTHGWEVLDSLAYTTTEGERPVDHIWMTLKMIE